MQEDKPRATQPINYRLQNTKTQALVEHMRLVPRDADVLNKVFLKHKLPLLFDKEPT